MCNLNSLQGVSEQFGMCLSASLIEKPCPSDPFLLDRTGPLIRASTVLLGIEKDRGETPAVGVSDELRRTSTLTPQRQSHSC